MGTGMGGVREQTGGEGISMMCAPLLSGASEAQMAHPFGGFFWSMCHTEDRICSHFPRSTRYFDIFPRAWQNTPTF